jgi:hypothetical protein
VVYRRCINETFQFVAITTQASKSRGNGDCGRVGASRSVETSLPSIGKGGRLFSGTKLASLAPTSPFTAIRHYVLSDLLDEERGTGRCRPVASIVDRDERDRVLASLGNVYDGSITARGVVENAIQVDLIGDRRLRRLVVEGLSPEYIQF